MFEIEGIVIRVTPFRDNDAIVNVLCNDRIQSFLARGVLKLDSKNAPSINMYSLSKFQISKGKDGYSLRTGEVLDSHYSMKNNLAALAVSDLIGEITNKLVQSEDADKIYSWLVKSFKLLNDGFDPLTIGLVYFSHVLKEIGCGMDVDHCVICGQTSQITGVSYNDGGFICNDCLNPLKHERCSSRKLKILRYIFKVDIDSYGSYSFEKDEVIDLLQELSAFAYSVMQVSIKSIKLIQQL